MAGLSIESGLLRRAQDMFQYPEHDNIAALQTGLDHLLEWAGEAGKARLKNAQLAGSAGDLDLKQLQIDYTALFINAFPVTKAHPFAGWYEGDTIIMGPSDQKIRKFYSLQGVDYDNFQIPADHIMIELEFMALMAEQYEETQNNFFYQAMGTMMHEHMEHWVLRFLEKVKENARTDFYSQLAAVLFILFEELTVQLKEVA